MFQFAAAEPLEGNLILDINPSILYPIIDRLLGGGRDPTPITRRPLTEIELRWSRGSPTCSSNNYGKPGRTCWT